MATKIGVVFHMTIGLLLCIGLWDVLYNFEENNCEMTYMFEVPQYLKVFTSDNTQTETISEDGNTYSLYLYGEGQYYETIKNLHLLGIPVLYIPGHGGSYKQARSLGSVLLRKALDKARVTHFNVFTVDLKEELVGFYGGTLNAQVEFVHNCIKHILSLYQHSQSKPSSVVLVGHSMGGFIARSLFTLDDFDPKMVTTIVTLATPNLAPAFNFDHLIAQFYAKVNNYWKNNNDLLSHVTVVSIGGGPRDFQISSSLSKLPSNTTNHLSTITTAIPTVYVSADHQCIVWCKQLVLVTTRFLFDIIDSGKKQISEDVEQRRRSMNFHFSKNPGTGKVPLSDKPRKVKLSSSYAWKDVDSLLWSMDSKEAGTGTYFSFTLEDFIRIHAPNFIAKTDTKRDKWILACKSSNKDKCTEATDLSHSAFTAPEQRLIHINLNELFTEGFTHILFPSSQGRAGTLDVNILSDLELTSKIPVPHVFSNLWTFGRGYEHVVSSDAEQSRFYYKLEVDQFASIYQAFKLTLQSDTKNLLRTEVQWDDSQTIYGKNLLFLKLHSTPGNQQDKVFVHVYLKSEGPVVVNIKVEFFQVLGQIVRYLGVSLPIYVIANIMLTYGYQVNQMCKGQPCHSIVEAHSISSKPYKVQPFVSLIKPCYALPWFYIIWSTIGLPMPDSLIREQEHRTWFTFAPLVTFLFAFEILTLFLLIQTAFISIISKIMKIGAINWFSSSSANSLRVILHSSVLAVLLQIGSSFALFYMLIASLLYVCILYNEIIPYEAKEDSDAQPPSDDEATSAPTQKQPDPTSPSQDKYSVQLIITQLWLWLFILSAPSLGVLVVNFRHTLSLPDDPMLTQAMLASICFIIQAIQPTHDGIATSKLKFLSLLIFPICVLCVLISMFSMYRASWFVLFILGIHTMTQIF